MYKYRILFLTAIAISAILLAFVPVRQPAWGFFGHRTINRQAVYTLPPELIAFYKKHIEFITEHAPDPDRRRYATIHEGPRHFIDIDRYGEPPFPELPRNWTDALMQYSEYFFINEKNDTIHLLSAAVKERDSLVHFNPALFRDSAQTVSRKEFRHFFTRNVLPLYYEPFWEISVGSLYELLGTKRLKCRKAFAVDHFSEHGIVPYHLEQMFNRLVWAFKEKDNQRILRLSTEIGHYIGDAHVPLHTSQNYNGQLSGQDGIHAFWESRLPELFADESYDYWVGRAELIENTHEYFWNIVMESHALVDKLLEIELSLRKIYPPDEQECYEMRGNSMIKTQCPEFAAAYNKNMEGMVEDRMRSSIIGVGSIWYTAWTLAGKPDLRSIVQEPIADRDSTDLELEKAVKKGQIKGRPHE